MAAEFEGWAIVELMGHRKLAGYVREVTLAGAAMLRLDIPSDPPVTQYYGASSLYCMTPTTEELARSAAQVSRPTPISRYELPAPREKRDTPLEIDRDRFLRDDRDDKDYDELDDLDHEDDPEMRAEIAEAASFDATDIDEQRAAGARGMGK